MPTSLISASYSTCKVGKNTLIGSSTQVFDNAQITASVIGQRCIIGAGTVIRNSYIFDGTTIGPQCVVERSIIGAGVTVKEKSRVDRGCLVGDGVVVGPDAHLEPFERLSMKGAKKSNNPAEDEDEDSDLEEVEARKAQFFCPRSGPPTELRGYADQDSGYSALGKDSNAIVWPRGAPDEEDVENPDNYTNMRFMRIGLTHFFPVLRRSHTEILGNRG